jgi:predicted small secreted protein
LKVGRAQVVVRTWSALKWRLRRRSPGISPMFVKFFDTGAFMKMLSALILVVLAISSTACNTVHGIGKDIEKGGQAIEKAAK